MCIIVGDVPGLADVRRRGGNEIMVPAGRGFWLAWWDCIALFFS